MRFSPSCGCAAEFHVIFPFSIGSRWLRLLAGAALVSTGMVAAAAQGAGRDAGERNLRPIPNHVPSWACEENLIEAVPSEEPMGSITLVLARHPDRQQAFEKLLADQQNPASPQYHQWLTPDEIGARFGLTEEELDSITGWLESQGLHVDWVARARNFIGFSGSAGDVGSAFQTALNYYSVNGKRKMSIDSPPMVPAALAPRIQAITGLYTIEYQPSSQAHAARRDSGVEAAADSPQYTYGGDYYLIGPADFNTIYDVPAGLTGKNVTIAILGRAHTDHADFDNFKKWTGVSFADPTEVVPTAYGGKDPGPPYTSPPTGSAPTLPDQLEETGDVQREGSVAPDANFLLVVASTASGGLQPDAQYVIQGNKAQIITLGYHQCEYLAGPGEVDLWNGMYAQAAAEGISVFVSSGDGGAAGCDSKFETPPANPLPISINFLCSSSYITCVGGTEFNDASDYSKYWSSSNGAELSSALSYIPEGGWNDPLNTTVNPATTEAASSGGGVSVYIPTPVWQAGTGVPAARTGRYVPDVAFSASGNNGYVGCLAAVGDPCTGSGDSLRFAAFEGTSSGGDSMGAIAALLVQQEGKAQGNLAPHLYEMAKSSPSAFHDVTVATSGVSNCSVKTPSMCNNSIPSATSLTGGQQGYLVGVGYDEVTGLGSLDVGKFLDNYTPFKAPAAVTEAASDITSFAATLTGKISPNGQVTQYWFEYGTNSALSAATLTPTGEVSASGSVTVKAKISKLTPGQMYYFRLQGSSLGGNSSGALASFTTKKAKQTITFTQPTGPVTVKVGTTIVLSATASSGLPVTFSVSEGRAKLTGNSLKLTTAGTVVVAADQAGNRHYLAALRVTRTITVN